MKPNTVNAPPIVPAPAATAPAAALPQGPSLEERVNDIKRRLTLIHAATLPFSFVDFDRAYLAAGQVDDLIDVIRHAAQESLSLIEPIIHGPGEVACWYAPDGGTR